MTKNKTRHLKKTLSKCLYRSHRIKRMATLKDNPISEFESALRSLESLVTTMETKTMSLEEAIEKFEEGMRLSQACQNALETAKQKVDFILQKNRQSRDDTAN